MSPLLAWPTFVMGREPAEAPGKNILQRGALGSSSEPLRTALGARSGQNGDRGGIRAACRDERCPGWTAAGQCFLNISASCWRPNTRGPPGAQASVPPDSIGPLAGGPGWGWGPGPRRLPSAWLSWPPLLSGGHRGPGSMPGPAAQRRPIKRPAWPGSN